MAQSTETDEALQQRTEVAQAPNPTGLHSNLAFPESRQKTEAIGTPGGTVRVSHWFTFWIRLSSLFRPSLLPKPQAQRTESYLIH
jgi:hypothetical protein